MKRTLDLADIQGNIVRPYGRFGFPITRHLFFNIGKPEAGRRFVDAVRERVTSSERWIGFDEDPSPSCVRRPKVTLNIGFSFRGFLALDLPTRTLSGLPEEFIDGMASRWSILGDFDESGRENWDPIWKNAGRTPKTQVHVWISLNAQADTEGAPVPELEAQTQWLKQQAFESGGVTLLTGHRGGNGEYQDSSAIMVQQPDGTKVPTAKEHFGFTDGIGDPTFEGQYEQKVETYAVLGSGKIDETSHEWEPLAAGEFILGHASEAQELPPASPPWSFTRNGSFLAYRKLHQNVGSFGAYLDKQAELLQSLGGASDVEEAREAIGAKMVGRWRNGIPLAVAPTYKDAQRIASEWTDIPAIQAKGSHDRTPEDTKRLVAYETLLTNFRYAGDEAGARCPVAAHIRRANPRDALDPLFGTEGATPNSALINRRRMMRRGAPYGDDKAKDDTSEHGVIFMAICGSLFRQFEFVQQQWMHYGSSFNVGNDTDPVVGLRRKGAKFVVNANPKGDVPPFICGDMPQFVATRGGEYFFLPSLTALRAIAIGVVDPT